MSNSPKIVLRYKKGLQTIFYLIAAIGLGWLIYSFVREEPPEFFHIIEAAALLLLSVYLLFGQYGRVENGKIRRMDAFNKVLVLDKLTEVEIEGRVYILREGDREMAFNTRIMALESQEALEYILAQYGFYEDEEK